MNPNGANISISFGTNEMGVGGDDSRAVGNKAGSAAAVCTAIGVLVLFSS